LSDTTIPNHADLIEATTEIVSSYVGRNVLGAADVPDLIAKVHGALLRLNLPADVPVAAPLKPAVSIKKSVTPDFLICLEDGKKFKSLKRHLQSHFSMTPDEYRAKWGLPRDYPMVAPNYAQLRSGMAKSIGLGRKPAASKAAPIVSSAAKSTPAAKAKKAPAAKSPAKKAPSKK
jgi:predicted transcriptional regulator